MKYPLPICLLTSLIALAGCQPKEPAVDARLSSKTSSDKSSSAIPQDMPWLLHGLDNAETRFSSLADINTDNVDRLGLNWHFDYPTHRGLEATPLVVDGVIYTTGSWSMVFAHDARNGELLWFHDPQVPRDWAVHLCCDVVNRGVAYQDGSLYSGTLDGRLIALDAASGELVWEVQTTDPEKPYSITGAPRIVKDRIIIGNGGSEMGVRGYVSAYAVADGELVWRFHTVPGNPADGFESDAMRRAAESWGGGAWWEIGGGGTVWDSMAYDPELDILYVGVGNGAPWNRQIRSPDGGDNLFLSSILALNPDDGSYIWHYQTTPGETWDYTATQHMILADLEIAGAQRKVIMQAPKNGFFYVLDRISGELISAEPYATVTWASHIDKETGRPVETAKARYTEGDSGLQLPGPIGGHNWHPMSYNPQTGLVYIPMQDAPWVYAADENFEFRQGYWNTGTDNLVASMPDDPTIRAAVLATVKGAIVAWDPIKGEPRWRIDHAGPWNGGMLSTAGNLLFQGNAEGKVVAYAADSGQQLWSFDAQTGVVAPPITYRLDGKQYLAVVAGWGGIFALAGGDAVTSGPIPNRSRLLVFSLDGDESLPEVQDQAVVFNPPPQTATPEQIAQGKARYLQYCVYCHGDGVVAGGTVPDLRALTADDHQTWESIVLGGMHWKQGMMGFSDALDAQDSKNIQSYVIERAHHALSLSQ